MSEEHAVQVIETPGNPVASACDPRSPAITSGHPGPRAGRGRTGAAIRATGLRKSYRRHPALGGLDLEAPAGGVFGYLGPNAAGTTTRPVKTLLRPPAGWVDVLGKSPR